MDLAGSVRAIVDCKNKIDFDTFVATMLPLCKSCDPSFFSLLSRDNDEIRKVQ